MWICVSLFVVLFTLTILLAIFHYTTEGRKYWFYKNVPYEEPCPIFGNFGRTFTMRQSYVKTLQYFYNKFRGKKYVGLFQARRPTLMIIDLDLAKTILSSEFSHFSDRIAVNTDTRREPLLRNLANMSGAEWKGMRQIVTPTFSSAKMKAMFPLITNCAWTLKDTLRLERLYEVDVQNLSTRYTTDVIGSCAFGFDPESLKNPQSPFLEMSRRMFKMSSTFLLKRYCRTFFPRLFKFMNLRSYPEEIEIFFTDIIRQVLTERRSTGLERHDFVHLMLNVQRTEKGFPMTDELITSNSFIFMLAGLETSATTISFCFYHIAKDISLQEKLRSEIQDCLSQLGGLNYESVTEMRLLTQTVIETLRLHPPVPLTTRLCTSPCKLPDTDLNFKVKDAILIPIPCIQRDPMYFPSPEKFDPYRFDQDISPNGFLAFGEGPRSCPGNLLFYKKNLISINNLLQ